MPAVVLAAIYSLFFISGAAALIYQVVWVRSLSLVFGGSNLAVTTVLAVFMAGLAIGGYGIGKYVDAVKKPLRLYGLLELGIALFAVVFIGLMDIYPSIYVPLARGRDDAPLYLSFIRILFSVIVLIVPTTLMGGTLPVLSKVVTRQFQDLRRHLAFLYGCNTLGAVAGALAAGFFFLRLYSVSTTLLIAIAANVIIGLASILLQGRAALLLSPDPAVPEKKGPVPDIAPAIPSTQAKGTSIFPLKLALWGIGVSGFCALGYEVLWTRILAIVVGANVYSYTTMLVAFLLGIALGSQAYGLLPRIGRRGDKGIDHSIFWFGAVQIVIGLTALAVTLFIRDLPANSLRLQGYVQWFGMSYRGVRLWSNFILAFLYMVVPAFFMGLAFPLAGTVHAEYKRTVGSAVGRVLSVNTVGAILGAALSGYVMIYLFGIERSLQMFVVINIGFGLLVLSSLQKKQKIMAGLTAGLTAAALLFLVLDHQALRIWDTKYFAIFRTNQPEAFSTPEKIREALDNTDVLYYAEGADAIVSSIKVKGGDQAFLTNGRVEASSRLEGQLCQYTLGHLPMLLHKDPRNVLVVGTGSGMTLGATSAHPSVETITLAEIEPKVIGVARTFEQYNHHVLDNPKLKIVFNDGRNFLLTTKEQFDVITADPIHPWFRGAGYLYTTEYFSLVSNHLRPGGVVCQWLPIYEMTVKDLKSVVRTFGENFAHTMMWLTHNDAELVGSNSPIVIDEAELDRRISNPAIYGDLERVMMGSARDFLGYFMMGTGKMREFSRDGIINTDNNLYLEFSAPFSIHMPVMADDLIAIYRHRESILPYLAAPREEVRRVKQTARWKLSREAGDITGRAHLLYVRGRATTPEFKELISKLDEKYPWYAPGRFLKNEYAADMAKMPVLLQTIALAFVNKTGSTRVVEVSAVMSRISGEMTILDFVDNNARLVFAQLRVPGAQKDEFIHRFVQNLMNSIRAAYQEEAEIAAAQQKGLPPAEPTLRKIQEIITSNVRAASES